MPAVVGQRGGGRDGDAVVRQEESVPGGETGAELCARGGGGSERDHILVRGHRDGIAPCPKLDGEGSVAADQPGACGVGAQVVAAAGELQEALRRIGGVFDDITLRLELDVQPVAGAHDLRIDH